jgi:hypothetical protein
MNNQDPVFLYDEAIRFHGLQEINRLGVTAAEFDVDFLRGHLAVVHNKIHNPETKEVNSLSTEVKEARIVADIDI